MTDVGQRKGAAVGPVGLRSVLRKRVPRVKVREVLQKSELFRMIASCDALQLLTDANIVEFNQGEMVVKIGSKLDKVYLLASGQASTTNQEKSIDLSIGDVFEEHLLEECEKIVYYKSNLVAQSKCVFFEFDRKNVLSVMN